MVCRTRRPHDQLERAGRDEVGEWYVGRGPGRGVWWCRTGACAQQLGAAQMSRALRTRVSDAEAALVRGLAKS